MKCTFKILLLSGIAAVGLSSCGKWLDINYDPNSPSEEALTSDMIFPAAEMNLATSYGDYLRIVGGYYAQHYGQLTGTSNYVDYSQFNMSATRSSDTYTQLTTRCLNNLKLVREMASAQEDWGTYLAATILRAFTYQVLIDCYGSVPYTQALDPSNPAPAYDDGLTVYNGILAEIDDALSRVSGAEQVCTNFLMPDATSAEWIQLANALKLKILMRMHGAVDVDSQLSALVAEANFPTSDVAWADCWSSTQGSASPFYAEEMSNWASQYNVSLNIALLGTMNDVSDARLGAFFSPNANGEYNGSVSGTNFSISAGTHTAEYWCRPNISYDEPVSLISVAETEFFLAEYYAENGNSAQAQAHYEAAIDASFASAGVTGSENVYESGRYAWTDSRAMELIGIQKWVALGGTNNFEAWCELRRLGYPAFGTVEGEDMYNVQTGDYDISGYVPGTLYIPISCNPALTTASSTGMVLQRFPFAESSSSRNQNVPDYPGDAAPVFWAE